MWLGSGAIGAWVLAEIYKLATKSTPTGGFIGTVTNAVHALMGTASTPAAPSAPAQTGPIFYV